MTTEAKTTRCVACRAEFTEAELAAAMDCPNCHTTGVPCRIADDVQVKINWHELRILVMWAEARESQFDETHRLGVVAAIAKTLMPFRPRHDAGALTMLGEMAELQEVHPTAELRDDAGGIIVPGKKLM